MDYQTLIKDEFPHWFIRNHGGLKTGPVIASIALVASSATSEHPTLQIVKAEMSCTGCLDTERIIIDDPTILRMFFCTRSGVPDTIMIDVGRLDKNLPQFALEGMGPFPNNDGEKDTEEDLEMVKNAWKTCRLVWFQDKVAEDTNEKARKERVEEEAKLRMLPVRPKGRGGG
ncbi:hypothetical protein BDW02DRAFT_581793 [Decorospora gaudefroyi]|uniref:Uncharacterized protein n=1 Tax=Decorospora gaudefroyi TaxID=184978 RepID=A0A6A5K9L1_9PLEO|nr:hypothetical protein BDW02DRAFT_581793 [Decorospora gaudefroyi]